MDVRLSAELVAKVSNFVNGMKTATKASKDAEDKITKSTSSISRAVTSNIAGVFSVAAVVGFGKAVLDVTSEFQKFNAVLGNTLGSASLATIKLREIQDFAAKTPFAINELTGAFVKLSNSGFKPTGDQMRMLGDLASSTGKTFDQLAEAILDAQTGEFERLKEFGIRAKDAGDSVIFTYKGVQTQVEKASGAIRDYITNLGNAEGVSGSMAKISATLGGQISNLGDSWDQMLLSVGSNTNGVFNNAIAVISKALAKITQYNEELNIADQYDLGSDFFNQLNRAVNPFASKGGTDIELGVSLIKEARKEVGAFVSSSTQAARTTGDFGKAMADLSAKSKIALSSPAIRSEKVRKAIYDAFREGVIAIDDARKSFDAGGKDANFGTSSTKQVKTLSTVLKELATDVLKVENDFKNTFDDELNKKIDAHQKAINSLIDLGYKPASNAIKELQRAQAGLALGLAPGAGNTVSANNGITAPTGNIGVTGKSDTSLFAGLSEELIEYKILSSEAIDSTMKLKESISMLAEEGLSSTIGEAFSTIGQSLAEGTNAFQSVGQALLETLSSFLSQLGQMFIKEGIAQIGYGIAKNLILPGSGANNIAGGAGMIAAGSAISILGGASRGLSGRGSKGQTGSSIPQFASGVQNFKGGMALVGERGPELVNLPTGSDVIPNGRSRNIVGRNSNAPIVVAGEMRISLGQLVVALRNEEKSMNRLG